MSRRCRWRRGVEQGGAGNQTAIAEHRILRAAPKWKPEPASSAPTSTNLMKEGTFPRALCLWIRAAGWNSNETDDWITERLKERL